MDSASFKKTNSIIWEDISHCSQGLFTGFEPRKQEGEHSRHFSSKRQADEVMENTEQFGCTVDAPAIQELMREGNPRAKWKTAKMWSETHDGAPWIKITPSYCCFSPVPQLRPASEQPRPEPCCSHALSHSHLPLNRSNHSRHFCTPTQLAFRRGGGKPVRNSPTLTNDLYIHWAEPEVSRQRCFPELQLKMPGAIQNRTAWKISKENF